MRNVIIRTAQLLAVGLLLAMLTAASLPGWTEHDAKMLRNVMHLVVDLAGYIYISHITVGWVFGVTDDKNKH